MFRAQWRARQSAGARAGELIRQPGWIGRALVLLAVLLVAGVIAAGVMRVPRTVTLPAMVQGRTVTAARAGETAPAPGTAVQFRDAAGVTVSGVVTEVSATEVMVEVGQAEPASWAPWWCRPGGNGLSVCCCRV